MEEWNEGNDIGSEARREEQYSQLARALKGWMGNRRTILEREF